MLPVCLEKGTKVDLWSQFWEVEICRSEAEVFHTY